MIGVENMIGITTEVLFYHNFIGVRIVERGRYTRADFTSTPAKFTI